ncbi:TraX family protein [Stenotrophomonas sp. GD03908]|uniref:TraX family protein n=1 Tax=Stenotrophomonas maltophilia TaxID=40324 RepID=A0AAJ2TJF0_STEMA|nr:MULTISPECIES: TraX family protein [Stenotrophomonas]MBH1480935.1 conjugal transfer protein [Stenotrophomonas maltophilia]MDH0978137.1 TraX family protein [Stenotrophomonas sp. GD03908]MDQ7294355.1 TraX family protein [Stenotrophomonas sp. Sm0041]MDZ5763415.1 TraX family protein [Stenotrophomonas maltophilia]
MQATPTRMFTFDPGLSSGARELLKWIALLAMTGDHVAKVVFGGYVPVVSELGRIAFPLFALVMACNLAQPGADLRKSMRRLALWGLIAQPLHALAFGSWLPLNILLTFALAAVAVHALANNRPVQLLLAAGVLPMFVDYQWAGVGSVLLAWIAFRRCAWWPLLIALAAVCWVNQNGWSLLSIPVVLLTARVQWQLPRWRWMFYGYYVGHLLVLAVVARVLS